MGEREHIQILLVSHPILLKFVFYGESSSSYLSIPFVCYTGNLNFFSTHYDGHSLTFSEFSMCLVKFTSSADRRMYESF